MKKNMEDIDKNSSTTYSYEDLLNRSYKLVLNADYYKKSNGLYIDVSNDYNYMKNLINNGLDIKVVGVLKAKKDADYDKVGYKHSLTEYVINETSKKDIYKDQTSNKEINVLTGVKFSDTETTYEDVTKQLGIADLNNPSIINIYPKDFDSKEKIISLIDKYNDEQKKNGKEEYVIDYTDSLKMLVDSLTSIITIISVVLIGFVAISLIVSSIMISIITYISVLERTKEIGILRAIGASKKDVSRVFIAETIIEGLFAGCLGIFVAFLICQPINVLVEKFADISNIATLPIGGSIFLILLSVGLNVIAGIIPAKMAAKKDPVVALRSE
jgi:putative ABC transport system permease protein